MNVAFTRSVRLMRDLQKTWFMTKPENRPPDLLRLCKEAENRVDKALEEIEKPGTFFFAMTEE